MTNGSKCYLKSAPVQYTSGVPPFCRFQLNLEPRATEWRGLGIAKRLCATWLARLH